MFSNILGKVIEYFQNEETIIANDFNNKIGSVDLYYQIGFGKKIINNYWKLSNNGIPQSIKLKSCYNPTAICSYAFGLLELFMNTNEMKYIDRFKTLADWLVENQIINKVDGVRCITWTYMEDAFDLKAPWISGMAQGQAISLLVKAYEIFGEEKYLFSAKLAFEIFSIDEKRGGILSVQNNCVFIEEYPNSSIRHVLNGFIYAVLGIWDYYRVTKDKKAYLLFTECINTLKKNLYKYDCGYWSLYCLSSKRKMIASRWYHQVHISLLKALYQITNEEIFIYYYKRWLDLDNSMLCRMKALIMKVLTKNI